MSHFSVQKRVQLYNSHVTAANSVFSPNAASPATSNSPTSPNPRPSVTPGAARANNGTTSTEYLVDDWDPSDVAKFITSLGPVFKRYQDAFLDNGVDGPTLLLIDQKSELVELGVTSTIHQKRIMTAVVSLKTRHAAQHAASPHLHPSSSFHNSPIFSEQKEGMEFPGSPLQQHHAGLIRVPSNISDVPRGVGVPYGNNQQSESKSPYSTMPSQELKHNAFAIFDELSAKPVPLDKPEPCFKYMSEFSDITFLCASHYSLAFCANWCKQKVVLKVSKPDTGRMEFMELTNFSKIPRHSNVLPLVSVIYDFEHHDFAHLNRIALVVPFHRFGSLNKFMAVYRDEILKTDNSLINIALGMARGINALHQGKLLHRDIAARNFLVSDVGRIIISDFGMSREIRPHVDQIEQKTPQHEIDSADGLYQAGDNAEFPWRWCSPETLINRVSLYKSDVWMYGVSVWEMLCCDLPFKQISNPRHLLVEFQNSLSLTTPERCPQLLSDIIHKCTSLDVACRPDIKDIVKALVEMADEEKWKEILRTTNKDATNSALSRYSKLPEPEELLSPELKPKAPAAKKRHSISLPGLASPEVRKPEEKSSPSSAPPHPSKKRLAKNWNKRNNPLKGKNLDALSVDETCAWLLTLNLGDPKSRDSYINFFRGQEVDGVILEELTEVVLKNVGVDRDVHRKIILAELGKWHDSQQSVTNSPALWENCKTGNLKKITKAVKAKPEIVTKTDEVGQTLLYTASRHGRDRIVKYLFQHGAHINQVDHSRSTPLHAACWGNHKSTAELLLKYGADISIRNQYNQTAAQESEAFWKTLDTEFQTQVTTSTLLTYSEEKRLLYWIDRKSPGKMLKQLLYRASVHGFEAQQFHSRCDNRGPTVCIIKRKGSRRVFGGYTPLSWSSPSEPLLKHDKTCKSFVYTMSDSVGKPAKFALQKNKYAIRCKRYDGIQFRNAIYICQKPHRETFSFTAEDEGYAVPSGGTLCGSKSGYVIDEVEVFSVD